MKHLSKLIGIILCVCLSISVVASQPVKYQFEYEDLGLTIIFENTSPLSSTERNEIADRLAYNALDFNTSGNSKGISWCWLLGHDYQYEGVTAIEHKVSAKAPRCRRTIYEVTTCSKCDYMDATVINVGYIDCCPED